MKEFWKWIINHGDEKELYAYDSRMGWKAALEWVLDDDCVNVVTKHRIREELNETNS